MSLRASAVIRREVAVVGQACYDAILEIERKRQILYYSSLPDVRKMGELQRLFLFYTSSRGRYEIDGDDKSPLVMDGGRFVKLCHSLIGLFNKDFNVGRAQIFFDKYAQKKSLEYAGFVSAMKGIADIRMKRVKASGRFNEADARFIRLNLEIIYPSPSVKSILERMPIGDTYPNR